MSIEEAREIVRALIAELSGRAGFDGWWDGVDEDIREEIAATLAALLLDRVKKGRGK